MDLRGRQIIADGIGIAKYIDIRIRSEIHRNIGLQKLSKTSGKADSLNHVCEQIPRILLKRCKLRKKRLLLLVKGNDPAKQAGALRPLLQVPKIIGHAAEHQIGLSPLRPVTVQLLQAGNVGVVKRVADVNS